MTTTGGATVYPHRAHLQVIIAAFHSNDDAALCKAIEEAEADLRASTNAISHKALRQARASIKRHEFHMERMNREADRIVDLALSLQRCRQGVA
jgi:hypothetical protein